MKTQLTFKEAEGKWLEESGCNTFCQSEATFNNWLQYTVKDSRIYYDERFNTLRVDSEAQRKAKANHANAMQTFINSGGSLD